MPARSPVSIVRETTVAFGISTIPTVTAIATAAAMVYTAGSVGQRRIDRINSETPRPSRTPRASPNRHNTTASDKTCRKM